MRGKGCDSNLECATCFGASTKVESSYRYTYCDCSMSACLACETATRCELCDKGRKAIPPGSDPSVNSCQSADNCGNGLGYADEYQSLCATCPYEGCKACDLSDPEKG